MNYKTLIVLLSLCVAFQGVEGADLIPPLSQIRTERPRVLLRPVATPYAISLPQLKGPPRDRDFDAMLAQLESEKDAAAQSLVWLLTGDTAAADAAVTRLVGYEFPGSVDTFHVYARLTEFGLAYDWLYNYEGFTDEAKTQARKRIMPLAELGLRMSYDHMFHNYVWMSAGGTALWAMAIAGESQESNELFERIRQRFNSGLFPAMQYLDGLPSEPMGYWALYDLTPCALTLLAAQSAFEKDLVGAVITDQDSWLDRHFANLIHCTLPDMRYIPWGDLQSGPNGGVTSDMAGIVDALTWALDLPHGAHFSRWLSAKRGLKRFRGDTAIFYMLYTRHLKTTPAEPPLSFLAGNEQSGHFIARSQWDDGATIVAFRSTDHFGDHNHYDQGGFTVYRNGLLAVDPPIYRRVGGPQQSTDNHNTLLIEGQSQRPARGQTFRTIEIFKENLEGGKQLETGDILFYKETGSWAAVAGQVAQAYPSDTVQSCVRQLLFVRPQTIVVVDQLTAPAEESPMNVDWLLQLPSPPSIEGTQLWSSNGSSWIRCRPLISGGSPSVTATPVDTHRVTFRYFGKGNLTLVHLLDVGDEEKPGAAMEATSRLGEESVEVVIEGKTFVFETKPPFGVSER